jgi:hypothetical protein
VYRLQVRSYQGGTHGVDEKAGGRMNDPVPLRGRAEPDRVTPWQSLKVVAFVLIFFGPVLPLTIYLWRLAVGG